MSCTRLLSRASLPLRPSRSLSLRSQLPPTTPLPAAARAYATATVTSTRSNASAPLLANLEASWNDMPAEEQYEVHQQLKDLQKKDWRELSTDEKKAAYYVAFGPHGPRAPRTGPNHGLKVFLLSSGVVGGGVGIFMLFRSMAPPAPRTMTKEWQEATNEYMRSQNMNPISGVSSEGYKGKGMVQ